MNLRHILVVIAPLLGSASSGCSGDSTGTSSSAVVGADASTGDYTAVSLVLGAYPVAMNDNGAIVGIHETNN